jgi:hypothetical protein
LPSSLLDDDTAIINTSLHINFVFSSQQTMDRSKCSLDDSRYTSIATIERIFEQQQKQQQKESFIDITRCRFMRFHRLWWFSNGIRTFVYLGNAHFGHTNFHSTRNDVETQST